MQPSVVEFAAATTNFTKFCVGTTAQPGLAGCAAAATDAGAIVGQIALFNVIANKLQTGTTIANMTDIMSSASLAVNGNFAASTATASSMQLTGCGTGATAAGYGGTSATTATTATFPGGTNGVAGLVAAAGLTSSINGNYLCYNVPAANATAIVAQIYSATMTPAAQTNYTIAPVTVALAGEIRRDGVELQSVWMPFNQSAYNSRFFLTNTGALDAVCSVLLMSETGNTLTAGVKTSVTVPGTTTSGNVNGGALNVPVGEIVASASGVAPFPANRGAVRFVCSAPSAAMQGTMVITTSTGVTNTPMIRPNTN